MCRCEKRLHWKADHLFNLLSVTLQNGSWGCNLWPLLHHLSLLIPFTTNTGCLLLQLLFSICVYLRPRYPFPLNNPRVLFSVTRTCHYSNLFLSWTLSCPCFFSRSVSADVTGLNGWPFQAGARSFSFFSSLLGNLSSPTWPHLFCRIGTTLTPTSTCNPPPAPSFFPPSSLVYSFPLRSVALRT